MTSNETTPAKPDAEHRLTDLIDRWKIDTYPAADIMPALAALPEFLADLDAVLRDLRQERSGHIGTMNERDRAQDAADKLAYAIAPVEVIGEHSSGNDPWAQALDVLLERPDLTRKALNEAQALNGVHERVIARLRDDLAEARRQVQDACCGPWHERQAAEAGAAEFPWGRVRAAREVAERWHSHAYREATKGPLDSTVTWAVAQTVLSLVLAELDYDGIVPRDGRKADAHVPANQDDDAPTCRDCGTWPCGRHATAEDKAEYAQAIGSDAAESGAAK